MNTTNTIFAPSIGGPRLAEGQTVHVQGYQFIVTDLCFTPDKDHPGYEIMRYTGVCTDHARNDDIRNTGYNGGTYGYRVEAKG